MNHGLVQRVERIKILGLEIGQNMQNINWEKKLPKIKIKIRHVVGSPKESGEKTVSKDLMPRRGICYMKGW